MAWEHVPAWRLEWVCGMLASRLDKKSRRRLPDTRKGQRRLYGAYAVGLDGSRRRRSVLKRAGEFGELAEQLGKEIRGAAGKIRKRRKAAQEA